MKILYLIPSFGSGGAERQLSIIAPLLAESGFECHVGYCQEGPNLQPLLESSVHLHRIDVAGNHDPRLLWQVWSLIRRVKPDVVHTWLLQMDVVGGVAALLSKVPFVLSERSSTSAYPPGWKIFLRKKIGMFASSIVANSQGGMDYWMSLRTMGTIHLIRNCVISAQYDFGDLYDELPATPFILFAGRLSPEKNVLLLLDALVQVVNIVPEYLVIMFGDGPLRDDLQRKITDYGMGGRIRLGGYTSGLAAWLNRADVCVTISNFEGNPNVTLEAAALGCPLVLSDIPAHREIFDETSAVLVNHKSVDSVSKGILWALREKGERLEKAEKAKHLVASYSPDVILAEYRRFYSDVVDLKSRNCNKIKVMN